MMSTVCSLCAGATPSPSPCKPCISTAVGACPSCATEVVPGSPLCNGHGALLATRLYDTCGVCDMTTSLTSTRWRCECDQGFLGEVCNRCDTGYVGVYPACELASSSPTTTAKPSPKSLQSADSTDGGVNSPGSGRGGLSNGEIIGIAVGGVVFLGLCAVLAKGAFNSGSGSGSSHHLVQSPLPSPGLPEWWADRRVRPYTY
jgi:hypothetical protein